MNNFKKVVTMVLAFAMVLTCVMVTPAQAAGNSTKRQLLFMLEKPFS